MFTKTLEQLDHLQAGKKKPTMTAKIMGAEMQGPPMDPGTKQSKAPDGQPEKPSLQERFSQIYSARGR